MNKADVWFVTAALSLVLSGWAFCPAYGRAQQLGFEGPLTGAGAGWGNDIKNVLVFANEKLANGRYSVVFEDDNCNPKNSRSAAQKLISINRVKQAFVACGQAVMATAGIYKRAGVTVMAPFATPSRISNLGVFRTSPSDAYAAKRLAERIAARHKTVYVLSQIDDYTQEFLKDFLASAKESRLMVFNEDYLPDEKDFRPLLLKLKSKNIEALFLNTQSEQVLLAQVRQLQELAIAPRLYGAYLPGSQGFLKAAGALAEGIEFVDFPGAAELLSEEGQKLYAEYQTRFGPLQGWSFAFPATFEAFRAVHLALSSGQPVGDYLQHNSFDGIFGRYSFDEHGDIVGLQHVMRVVRKGQGEVLR